jgi:hypothetical protein
VFNIESKAQNVIGLEVALSNLLHALRAGPGAEWVQLKLTKRGPMPYLCVEAQTVDGGVAVLQDVPVRVLNAGELSRYSEPSVPNPVVRRARGGGGGEGGEGVVKRERQCLHSCSPYHHSLPLHPLTSRRRCASCCRALAPCRRWWTACAPRP